MGIANYSHTLHADAPYIQQRTHDTFSCLHLRRHSCLRTGTWVDALPGHHLACPHAFVDIARVCFVTSCWPAGFVPCSTYGVVLKARHKETGQIVAIKKIKESDKDEKIRQNTVREVRILKVQ